MKLDKLVGMLRNKDEATRLNAVRGLEMCPDSRVPDVLRALASKDPSTRVRYEARKAYEKLTQKPAEAAPASKSTSTKEQRDGFLDHRVFTRRYGISDAETKIKLIDAIEKTICNLRRAFSLLLKDEEDERVRAKFARSLGSIGGVDDIPAIASCLMDDDPRVRANAIEGLERLGHPKAYSYITHLLADSDNRIRANVIKALQSYGKRNLETILKEMLNSEHVSMRDSAAYCLAVIATEEHMPLLDKGVRDPERSVRRKIRTALERLSREGSEAAKEKLASFSEQTAVFHIGSRDDFSALLEGASEVEDLNHEETSRRMDAISRITARNDRKFVPMLCERLKEETTSIVSVALIDAIKSYGEPSTISTLSRKLGDEDPNVASRAAFAMLELDFDEAAPFVAVALNHPSAEVRGSVFVRVLQADPEMAIGQLETLCRSTKKSIRRSVVTCFEATGEAESALPFHERMDGLALAAFRNEMEEELFEPFAHAYAAVATKGTLDDFFMLLAELEEEERQPDHSPRRGERPIVLRLAAIRQAKHKIIKSLPLSPEEVGTYAGRAEAKLRANLNQSRHR